MHGHRTLYLYSIFWRKPPLHGRHAAGGSVDVEVVGKREARAVQSQDPCRGKQWCDTRSSHSPRKWANDGKLGRMAKPTLCMRVSCVCRMAGTLTLALALQVQELLGCGPWAQLQRAQLGVWVWAKRQRERLHVHFVAGQPGLQLPECSTQDCVLFIN